MANDGTTAERCEVWDEVTGRQCALMAGNSGHILIEGEPFHAFDDDEEPVQSSAYDALVQAEYRVQRLLREDDVQDGQEGQSTWHRSLR